MIFSRKNILVAAILIGSLAVWGALARPGHAAPLSGGQGNPPYQKLAVYQGIIVLAPNATQVLRIGNFNATYSAIEIESNGSPALRPKNSAVTIAAQNTSNEGGQIRLLPGSAAYPEWHIDAWGDTAGTPANFSDDTNYARIFTSTEKFRIGPSGDSHVIGHLCFGAGTSPAECLNQWVASSASGNQDLNSVLTYGNRSQRTMRFQGFGGGILSTYNDPFGFSYDPNLNGITAKSSTSLGSGNGSALYGENPNGYAAAYIGRVGIFGSGGASTFGADTELRVGGSVSKATGAVMEINNPTALGSAARIKGLVSITGSGAGVATATETEAVLNVSNTSATGTTIKSRGGGFRNAIIALAGAPAAGNTTYGVYAEMGTVSAGGISYAGYFRGPFRATTINVRPYGGSEPWGLKFDTDPQLKQTVDLRVCEVSSNTCLGKYIQTLNGSNRQTAQYCYDNGAAIICANIYSLGPPTVSCSGAPTDYPVERSPSGVSYHAPAACVPLSAEYVVSGTSTPPYGSAGQWVCVDSDFNASFTPAMRQSSSGCVNNTASGVYDRLGAAIITNTYVQSLELR